MDGSMATSTVNGAAIGTGIAPGVGTIIGAGIGMLGGMFSNSSAKKSSNAQRSWEAYMAGTAHEREMIDLRRAGLNPILTATGGAGAATPSSAAAPTVDWASQVERGANSGRALADMKLDRDMKIATVSSAEEQNTNLITQRGLMNSQANQARASENKMEEETRTEKLAQANIAAQNALLKQEFIRGSGSAAAAANQEKIKSSSYGKFLDWVNATSEAIQGAGGAANSARDVGRDRNPVFPRGRGPRR